MVNCDAPLPVSAESSGGGGGLFSMSGFALPEQSTFRSAFAPALASVEDVDDETDGGLASEGTQEVRTVDRTARQLHVRYGSC